jgi:6-pyruvoyltetrahydropterin/6-carboxytetrahydropterin synthase
VVEVTLWETEASFATYRPTPGAAAEPLRMKEVAGR